MRINYDKRFKYSVPGFFFSYSVIVGAKLLWSIDHGENVLGRKDQGRKWFAMPSVLRVAPMLFFCEWVSKSEKQSQKYSNIGAAVVPKIGDRSIGGETT